MIAAAAGSVLTLARTNMRRALWFALAVGGIAVAAVMAVNRFEDGRFLDNTVRANINPLSVAKIRSQFEYLALVGGSLMVIVALCGFFFQAEDGIRDSSVTGVQTCALPI